MIKAGKYLGKPINWGVGETNAGKPQVIVMFAFKDDENKPHEMAWYGSLNEGKAREISLKALLNCGLKGNDLNNFAGGVKAGALDPNQEVELTVELEPNDKGQTYPKIQWVNRPGGVAFKNLLPPQDAKSKIASLNLKGDLLALREKTGMKEVVQTKRTVEPEFPGDEDDDFGF